MTKGGVRVLDPWQVWDPGRGCFYVDLRPTAERHHGRRVYTDAVGHKLVIRGAV